MLGPVEVRDGDVILPSGSARERLVLAVLLLDAGRTVAVDRLIDALWDDPPRSAKGQVHNVIRNLRRRLRTLGDDLIATRPLGYELALGDHTLDLTGFRRLAEQGRRAAEAGDHGRAKATLDEALGLWRGPALADIPDRLAGPLRQSLHEERLAAEEVRIESGLALGLHEDVLRDLDRLLTERPYRELLYEMRMRALAAVGRRADALATYRQAYERLVDDLGVEPGPALRDLEARILRGEDLAARPSTRIVPRQLPMALATLTGRDKLLHEVSAELRRSSGIGPPVGVLVGPGGIGKTTLAIAVAQHTVDTFVDGQLYADLRGSHDDPGDPLDLLGGFLRALGIGGSDLPSDLDERAALYRSTVADSRILVLLDDVADERQVRPLLPGAAGCGVLVTSRRRLGALIGSRRWTVPGLRPDDSVDLIGTTVGAERLDAERDAAEAMAATCGHLPLAVSIAAARLATRPERSLVEFAARLADERRRLDELRLGDLDVRTSIGLTYHSLDVDHQRLFRRLGLLAGPDWPSWVAYEVAGGNDVTAQLDALTDVHLVESLGRDQLGQSRYQLHDLVAEYAQELAHAEDPAEERAAAVRQVVDGWLALATQADAHVPTGLTASEGLDSPPVPTRASPPTAETAGAWFDAERDSLVGAVVQAAEIAADETTAKLALRMSGYLTMRAYDEQREHVLRVALRPDATEPEAIGLRVRLLSALFAVRAQRADYADLPTLANEQVELARQLGDKAAEQAALRQAGWAARNFNRLQEAAELLQTALAIEVPSDHERARVLGELGAVYADLGDPARGEPLIAQLCAATRASGPSRTLAVHLLSHAELLTVLERLDEAQSALDEMRAICQELGDELGLAYCRLQSADVDVWAGRLTEAGVKLRDTSPYLHDFVRTEHDPEVLRVQADLAAAERRWADMLEPVRLNAAIARGLGWPLDVARNLAREEVAHRMLGDDRTAAACRRDWQAILDELDLDERSLLPLPSFLTRTP